MEILLWVALVVVGTLLYLTARVAARVLVAVATLIGAAAVVVYAGVLWHRWFTANQRV
jgi:hypothetical protein